MDLAPALGLLGLLFVKEIGVPIPVPGDLLVIGAGVAAAASGTGALVLLAGILIAGYVGGTLQFLFVRGAFRSALLRLLRRAGIPEARIETLAGWLRKRGAVGVATARATPAVRIGAIAASGLAGLALPPFLAGLVIGNGLFVTAHFALGVIVGPAAVAAVSSASGPLVALVALAILAALGYAGWKWLQASRVPMGSLAPAEGTVAADKGGGKRTGLPSFGTGAWADAACPACLAISLVTGDRS